MSATSPVSSGIVEKDPKLPDRIIMPPPPQRTTQSVFDQEDKATVRVCVCVYVYINISPC